MRRRRRRRSGSRVSSRTSLAHGGSPSTTSRPGSFARTRRPSDSGSRMARAASARSSTASRSSALVRRKTSRTACCSSRRSTRGGLPGKCSRSMEGSNGEARSRGRDSLNRLGIVAITPADPSHSRSPLSDEIVSTQLEPSARFAAVLEYLEANHDGTLVELIEFAAISSVSTDPAHARDVTAAAAWVAKALTAAGQFSVRTIPTGRNPVVYAEWLGAPGKPTVLVYGHYDVQPPDPLDKWHSPPFTPTVRD